MNTSGPAFPVEVLDKQRNGMTLRDYFAAKALTGFLETAIDWIPTEKQPDFDSLELFKDLARDSYVLADAMLKARDGNS